MNGPDLGHKLIRIGFKDYPALRGLVVPGGLHLGLERIVYIAEINMTDESFFPFGLCISTAGVIVSYSIYI